MPTLEPLIPHVVPFLLVFFRILGLFLAAPLLSSANLPRQPRVLLAVTFAASIYAFTPVAGARFAGLDLLALAPLMGTELLIGFSLGLIAGLPLIALQMAGYIMGYQMGLALAEAYNPELDTNAGVLGQIMFLLGIMMFIAIGGLDLLFLAIANSFERVPPGAFGATDVPLEVVVGLVSSGFEFALRVAAPVTGIIVLMLVAMGFIMKTMPQVNVLSIGFAAKILSGLLMLTATLIVIDDVAAEDMADSLRVMLDWIDELGAGGLIHG